MTPLAGGANGNAYFRRRYRSVVRISSSLSARGQMISSAISLPCVGLVGARSARKPDSGLTGAPVGGEPMTCTPKRPSGSARVFRGCPFANTLA
jgi:hypothetical protein